MRPEVTSQHRVLRITTRNARFQQWHAMLNNRTKRQRSGEFLVQGVRPISMAVQHGWTISTIICDESRSLSKWATELLDNTQAVRVAMSPELLQELGGKSDDIPEMIAVVQRPSDDYERIPLEGAFLVLVFDRPTSPGNIGTLIRSADAFGASGVIVTGHAADVYDPKTIRASTGSLFAIPVIRAPSHQEVLEWIQDEQATRHHSLQIVGTDEQGPVAVADHDFTKPTVLIVGNETAGLSAAWRSACHQLVRIPMSGSASSLNAASAATVVLYEAARQKAAIVQQDA